MLNLVLSSSDSLIENISHFSSQFLSSDHYFFSFTVALLRSQLRSSTSLLL